MATFARDYAATNGPADPIFTQYFGTDPKAFSAVIGIWEALLTSNKEGVRFRCDNPDGVSPAGHVLRLLNLRIAASQDGEGTGEVITLLPRPSFAIFHTPIDSTTESSACMGGILPSLLSPTTGLLT